ncbi:methyltransferase [Rhodococcus sp. Leaf278]|uniref:methyltransferase n=1 Tax=Rhodococcus sp. Leaf278 TaxID=1736319 RepID=UPI000A9F5746|nr:methyltransferase [Rhodococcus sp. Leaf278]
MSTSSPSSSAARCSRPIDVRVSSRAPIGYDDTCASGERRFLSPSAAARFAVSHAAALDAGVPGITVTIAVEGHDEVCVSGTAGEIACALAAMAIYSAGVRTARIPAPDYLRAAVDEVTLPIQWQGSAGVEAGVDMRVLSTRPDPLPYSTLLLGHWAPDLAHRLAHDLARSITERSGRRSPVTVTYLPDQGRYEITHPDPISDADADAVARYIRITRLRANLGALDPVADADCAVGLAAELHVLESYSRRVPSTDDRTVR